MPRGHPMWGVPKPIFFPAHSALTMNKPALTVATDFDSPSPEVVS